MAVGYQRPPLVSGGLVDQVFVEGVVDRYAVVALTIVDVAANDEQAAVGQEGMAATKQVDGIQLRGLGDDSRCRVPDPGSTVVRIEVLGGCGFAVNNRPFTT